MTDQPLHVGFFTSVLLNIVWYSSNVPLPSFLLQSSFKPKTRTGSALAWATACPGQASPPIPLGEFFRSHLDRFDVSHQRILPSPNAFKSPILESPPLFPSPRIKQTTNLPTTLDRQRHVAHSPVSLRDPSAGVFVIPFPRHPDCPVFLSPIKYHEDTCQPPP